MSEAMEEFKPIVWFVIGVLFAILAQTINDMTWLAYGCFGFGCVGAFLQFLKDCES